jgi:multimeric flavodoxin WrbA
MKILGISASQRKWGNTDILIQHVLRGAEGQGAETRFLRLTDFDLRQCKGCLSCVLKDRDCVIEDELPEVLEPFRWADGVVLGSPIYLLCATGSIQQMTPRFFGKIYNREFEGKPGLSLVVGGMSGWETFALPQVSLFFLLLGMPIVDQFVAYGQGPGEIFYDEKACHRARESGEALARGDTAYRGEAGTCPVCHFHMVATSPDGSAHCTLCDLPGTWVEKEETMRFEPLPGAEHRWTSDHMRHHFEEVVLGSVPTFRSKIKEIQQKLEVFRREEHGLTG